MKILYLIIASNNIEHIRDEESQRKTWAKAGENIVWLRGGEEEKYDPSRRTLFVQVEEIHEKILEKTVLGIKWCVDNLEFDYLIRSNVSTFFVEQRVNEILEKVNWRDEFLGGFIEFIDNRELSHKKRQFVNGAAIFLNRKSAKILTKLDYKSWSTEPDDYAISQFLISKGAKPFWISRGNIGATSILRKRAYYRLKSSENPHMASKRMENLFAILSAKNTTESINSIVDYYSDEIRNIKRNHRSLWRYCKSVYSVQVSKLRFFIANKSWDAGK